MTGPELSLVIAAQEGATELSSCLRSLLDQKGIREGTLELIVVGDFPQGALIEEQIEREFWERLAGKVFFIDHKNSVPVLHGMGIDKARGELVAVSESHVVFDQLWASVAIESHKLTEASVIGGVVLPGENLKPVDSALFFCDYGQFLPETSDKALAAVQELPGNNIVFKRNTIGQTPDGSQKRFSENGFWKSFLLDEFKGNESERGHAILSNPEMIVTYNRTMKLSSILKRRFDHGRCYGGMRRSSWTVVRRISYILLAPVVPPLLLFRLIRNLLPKRRYFLRFLGVIPLCMLFLLTWCVGEWIGWALGSGDSCQRL